MVKKSKSPSSEVIQKEQSGAVEQSTQDRFEERCNTFMGELSEVCDKEKVRVAVAIVVDPEIGEENPLVYARGPIYEQARVVAELLRNLKEHMAQELRA
jgi:hypothetical protein